MPVTIVEVKRRAEQGVTRPFLCMGDDGNRYWAKGNFAGKAALCYEWMAGRIAQDFDLPIPPFVQAAVPSELIRYSARSDISDLGAGLVFASEHAEGADEFTLANMRHASDELRRRLLAFDWLVQNEDRTLGARGGNVNLLFLPKTDEVRVIDHNLAFDPDFGFTRFRCNHVFRADINEWPQDLSLDIERRVRNSANRLAGYFAELPAEWTESAALLAGFSLGRIQKVMNRFGGIRDLFLDVTL